MGEALNWVWKLAAPLVATVATLLLIPQDRRSAFGISELVKEFFRSKRQPREPSEDHRPRVLICMLIGTKNGDAREDLYEALSTGTCGKMFDVEYSGRSFSSRSAHRKKQREMQHHLKQRNADILVHGHYNEESKTYFLSFYRGPDAAREHRSVELDQEAAIEGGRIKELAAVIAERVLTSLPEGFEQGGRYVADKLGPLIPQLEHVLTKIDPENIAARWSYRNALYRLADQSGQNHWLDQAIAFEAKEDSAGRGAKSESREERGKSLMDRADALATKGQRGDDQALVDAITAYRDALKEWTRERVPLQWAMTQNNLGAALQVKGQRGDDQALVEEAIACFQLALEERTEGRAPFYHHRTKENLERALALRERSVGEG